MGALEDLMQQQQQAGMMSPLQGLMQVPQSPQMTRALPGYENMSPFELAAMRQRETVRPTAGRAGEGPSVRSIFDMTPVGRLANYAPKLIDMLTSPGSPAMRDIEIPRTSNGPSLADILGATTTPAEAAGAGDFGEPQPQRQPDVQKQMEAINKGIAPQQTKLDRLRANFEAGRIDKNEYNRQRIPLESQIERGKGQITEIDSPYQRDLNAWETRKNDFLTNQATATQQLQAKKANAEMPFRIKHPDATNDIIKGGGALTGLTALTLGALSKGKLGPSVGAAGIGALEGGLVANVPELLDLSGQQTIGGEGWNKTLAQFTSPENLVKTGAEAGLHAGGAAALSYGTSLVPKVTGRIGENFRNWRSPPPQPTSGAPPSQPPAQGVSPSVPGGSVGTPSQGSPGSPAQGSYVTYKTQGGQEVRQTPKGYWQGVDPGTGKSIRISKPDGPLEKLMKGE